jgi:uncharacterized membrane protein
MNAAIGVYDSHEKAIEAVKELKDAGYPVSHLSIIGKAEVEVVDKELHTQEKNPLNLVGVGVGTTVGATLGILAGVGVFAVPGLGFLYGAGALVGAIAGFDFGLIGGGIASVLATVGLKDHETKDYQDHLEEGKYLVIAQGSKEDVAKAMDIVKSHGQHTAAGLH